jgi:ribonuclease BN (tRNA processing enzyme)
MAQLYEPGWTPRIFAPALASRDTGWVNTIFESRFFPVPYDQLPNRPHVELVDPGEMRLAGMEISSIHLNHPGGALAYRIRGGSGDLVYATDHEFGNAAFDEPLAAFARGASALILDAHFTPDEMTSHAGWGHSDWRRSAEFAASNDIGRLWLFHHKPGRTDAELTRIESEARQVFAATKAASEGESFSI